jgi:hypothetical protein
LPPSKQIATAGKLVLDIKQTDTRLQVTSAGILGENKTDFALQQEGETNHEKQFMKGMDGNEIEMLKVGFDVLDGARCFHMITYNPASKVTSDAWRYFDGTDTNKMNMKLQVDDVIAFRAFDRVKD